MSYPLLLGPMLEEKYSSRTLAAVIAITAFGTGLVNSKSLYTTKHAAKNNP